MATSTGDLAGTFGKFQGAFSGTLFGASGLAATLPKFGGELFASSFAYDLIEDSVDLTDAILDQEIANIADTISLTSSDTGIGTYQRSLADSLRLLSVLSVIVPVSLSDSVEGTETWTATAKLKTAIIEALTATEALTGLATLSSNIADVVYLTETLSGVFAALIAEIAEFTESVTTDLTLNSIISDTLELTEVQALVKIIVSLIAENLEVNEAITAIGTFKELLADALSLNDILIFGDTEYQALVLNTGTDALFRYLNYPFNSFSGKLAAAKDGIYLLEGSDDAGTDIDATFDTGFSDLGLQELKRLQLGYMALANDGEVRIKVTSSQDGSKEADWYELTQTFASYDDERVLFHNGIRSKYWKFQVSNVDGSDLDLDNFTIYPVLLVRRRQR